MVLCKETINPFRKGRYYKLDCIMGNPHESIEAGEEFMSSDFFDAIRICQGRSVYWFLWRGSRNIFIPPNLGYFQDFFIYSIQEERQFKIEKIRKN